MEPVRTPSQAIVIFIFLMITIFDFKDEGPKPQPAYTQLLINPEELVEEPAFIHTSYNQSVLQYNKTTASGTDTLHQSVNFQEYRRLRSEFTNFVYPVSVAWPTHINR